MQKKNLCCKILCVYCTTSAPSGGLQTISGSITRNDALVVQTISSILKHKLFLFVKPLSNILICKKLCYQWN